MRIAADVSFAEARDDFAILLVAGGPALPVAAPDPALTQWLRRAPDRAPIYGSVCTGALAPGHAGLLDGRRVTPHLQNAAPPAAQIPAAQVRPHPLYTRVWRLGPSDRKSVV